MAKSALRPDRGFSFVYYDFVSRVQVSSTYLLEETTSVLLGAREGYFSYNGLVKRCSILFPTRLYIVQYLTTRAKSVLLFDRLAWDKLSTKEVRVWSALYKSLKNENLGHFLELEPSDFQTPSTITTPYGDTFARFCGATDQDKQTVNPGDWQRPYRNLLRDEEVKIFLDEVAWCRAYRQANSKPWSMNLASLFIHPSIPVRLYSPSMRGTMCSRGIMDLLHLFSIPCLSCPSVCDSRWENCLAPSQVSATTS
jgi:hypothetical protein